MFAAPRATREIGENDPDVIRIAKAIQKMLIGKTLVQQSLSRMDEGKSETNFIRERSFQNLRVFADGLSFDELVRIKQEVWDLDANGNRVPSSKDVRDRQLLRKHEGCIQHSTGHIIGQSQVLSNSFPSPSIVNDWFDLSLADDELRMMTGTARYSDDLRRTKPVATEFETLFRQKEGVLSSVYKERVYRVNPLTGSKAHIEADDFEIAESQQEQVNK